MLLKTFMGTYGFAEDYGNEVAVGNRHDNHHHSHNNDDNLNINAGDLLLSRRYPSLPIYQLLNVIAAEHQWSIESIRISHVRLLGTRLEFQQLARCLAQCHALSTVILGDSRTDFVSYSVSQGVEHPLNTLTGDGESQSMLGCSGLDAMVSALGKASHLQEVSLQNIPDLSSEALGALCLSSSIVKLQLLLSQSVLPTGSISGNYIQPLTQTLKHNHTLKELRIFGVLDYDACHHVSQMLLVNTKLQKLALKIKLKPSDSNINSYNNNTFGSHDEELMETTRTDNSPSPLTLASLPLLTALASSACSLTSLEIYISGARTDLEKYATAFTAALRVNQSLTQLNVIFYGLETFLTTSTTMLSLGGGGGGGGWGALAAMRTNELWMSQLGEILQHGNYTLHQILINHGMFELSDAVKLYLRLNRAGRRHLLTANQEMAPSNHGCRGATTVKQSEMGLWVETLARVRDDLSCIFYLVSCNPTLFCGEQQHRKERFRTSAFHSGSNIAWRHEKLCKSPPLKKKR